MLGNDWYLLLATIALLFVYSCINNDDIEILKQRVELLEEIEVLEFKLQQPEETK